MPPVSRVPGMVRGMAALHAAHGKMRWEQLVVPAEAKARFETQISRALARDLQVFGGIAGEDPAAKAVFLPTGSTPPGEGQSLQENDLANVLGQLRQRGAGAFYSGQLGEKIAAGLGIDAR